MRTFGTPAPLRSMRARMTALFALLVALLMLVGGAALQRREERRAERRVRDSLQSALVVARFELSEPDNAGKSLLETVRGEQGEIAAGGLALLVVDASGKVLWQSRRAAPHWPVIGDDWRFRTLSNGSQIMVVAHDWKPIAADLREASRGLWLGGLATLAGTALVAWFVVGRTLSPLKELADQAQNATIESLQVRLRSPSSDAEMRHLTATLNLLLGRLAKESRLRGRFYAAASHELRTPIQVLLGEIDVARSRPRRVAEYQEVLEQLQNNTERLAQLVSDLLQLNALEMQQNRAAREPLNLAFWVERAHAQQQTALLKSGLSSEIHLVDAPIEAPPIHLEMLLRNLIENAAKYGRVGTSLRINLQKTEAGTRFEVWNSCDLAPEADLETWFEPFFRLDEARASNGAGNGLGLAICRAICVNNGWNIALTKKQEGLAASVYFPENPAMEK